MAKVIPLLPPLLNMHEVFAPFCCPVIMWPTHWCWKEFHHRPLTPNLPGSLLLRGHSIFQLVSLVIRTSVTPHTPCVTPRQPESRVSVTFKYPRCRTVTWHAALLQAFDSTTKAALYVVSVACARRSFDHHLDQTPRHVFTRLLWFHQDEDEDEVEDQERTQGGCHHLCSVCWLPCL